MEEIKGVLLKNRVEVTRLISDFYYRLPEDFDYGGESHDGWEFVYVENGRVRIGVGEESYVLKKGELVCHQPFEFHSIRPHEGDASVMIFCFECLSESMEYFKSKILSVSQRQKQYLNDIAAGGREVFLPKDPLQIATDGAMDPSPRSTELWEQFVKNAIEILLLSLMNSTDATEKQSRVSLFEHVSQREALAERIAEYLRENMHRPVSLEEISGHFSYSLSSVKRIFKEVTGYSPVSYLNGLRLGRAKELLAESDLGVESIASTLGYANVYYFSTAFKKKFGESPSRYRTRKKAERSESAAARSIEEQSAPERWAE